MKMSSSVVFAFVLLTLVGAGCNTGSAGASIPTANPDTQEPQVEGISNFYMPTYSYQGKLGAEEIENKKIRITTAKGDIVFKLYPDVAPISVSNMVYLAKNGFYDGLNFHRREPGFVIQGGDPNGDGTGGPGYQIPAEFNSLHHKRGMVAMARSQAPNSAGSQFYITLDEAGFLDKNYTVFGEVVEGMDVVDKIEVGDVMTKVTVE